MHDLLFWTCMHDLLPEDTYVPKQQEHEQLCYGFLCVMCCMPGVSISLLNKTFRCVYQSTHTCFVMSTGLLFSYRFCLTIIFVNHQTQRKTIHKFSSISNSRYHWNFYLGSKLNNRHVTHRLRIQTDSSFEKKIKQIQSLKLLSVMLPENIIFWMSSFPSFRVSKNLVP